MNKRLASIIIILLFSITLISCTNENTRNTNGRETGQSGTSSSNQGSTGNKKETQAGNTDKLTIDDIKARYTGGENSQIVNLTTYGGQYILVEYSIEGISGHCFDFYNLKTGDKDTLPIYTLHVKLDKIMDENHIRFIWDGTNNLNAHRYFPGIVECNRAQEIIGFDGDFYQAKRIHYLQIDQGSEIGAKPNETIADIKVSLKGVEVLFEPMKGQEGVFYAAYTSVPYTKTSYDKEKNQFIIVFENTDIDSKFNKSKISEQNRFLSSVDIKRDGANTTLIINLKDTAKYYTIITSGLEPSIDDFPCLDLDFASEYKIDWP